MKQKVYDKFIKLTLDDKEKTRIIINLKDLSSIKETESGCIITMSNTNETFKATYKFDQIYELLNDYPTIVIEDGYIRPNY